MKDETIATITYDGDKIIIEPNLNYLCTLNNKQLQYIIDHETEHLKQKLWEMVQKRWREIGLKTYEKTKETP